MAKAYYNEHDAYAAAWLRNLIGEGLIAPGDVDERDIRDVLSDDLKGYTQCHFFAGIGGWSAALRQAGWPDERPAWTGSAPCQPFSAAGRQVGLADERHLWPAFHHLIAECKPPVVFGEQVEAAIKHGWLDLIQDDLEGIGYAFGAACVPAAGVGAPHIRQRLWFVGERLADGLGLGRWQGRDDHRGDDGNKPAAGGELSLAGLADSDSQRLDPAPGQGFCPNAEHDAESHSGSGRLGDGDDEGLEGQPRDVDGARGRTDAAGSATEAGSAVLLADTLCGRVQETGRGPSERTGESGTGEAPGPAGPTNGFWRTADWLGCRDGKWRPVEPGTFPLADGSAFRVGSSSPFEGKSRVDMLRGYGNAIVPQVAAEVVRAYMGCKQ